MNPLLDGVRRDGDVVMDLPIVGEVVTRVAFDAAVSLVTTVGELRVQCSFELEVEGSTATTVDPFDAAPHAATLVRQHGRAITVARVAGGVLELRIGTDVVIRVLPDEAYEAWTYSGDDGTLVVSTPGGELTTWGPR